MTESIGRSRERNGTRTAYGEVVRTTVWVRKFGRLESTTWSWRPWRDSCPLASRVSATRRAWIAPADENDRAQRGSLASLMPASWNQIVGWLKQIDAVRQAA